MLIRSTVVPFTVLETCQEDIKTVYEKLFIKWNGYSIPAASHANNSARVFLLDIKLEKL